MQIKYLFTGFALLLSACATTGLPENNSSYLIENATRSDVVVTESGLQYETIKAGTGEKPDRQSEVTVHYVGTLTDGTEFDNSRKRNAPATFPLNGAIPGFTEGLQLMQVGGISRIVVPAYLAYGEKGNGERIRPGATLVFDIELLDLE